MTIEENDNVPALPIEAWACLMCGYHYTEIVGAPEQGIAPGTPWAKVDADFTCPECGVDKSEFDRLLS